jgi:hypothetical protein
MEAGEGETAGGGSDRGRNRASIALAAAGAVLAVIGALLLYVRVEIIDPDAFADHAVEALEDDRVRDVVSTEIVVQLIERGSADLVAARPVLEQAVGAVLDARAFEQIFRAAARESNRLLFDKGKDNVAFDVSDGLKIVRFGLQSINPKLADDLPKSIDLALLKLKERDFARGTLEFAVKIRWLAIVGPIIALLVLLAAVLLERDRRVGILRAALAVGIAGALIAIVYLILRARILAGVIGEEELTDEEIRGAVAGILDAFVGGLFTWGLVLALVGLVIAGAAAALDPDRTADPVVRAQRAIMRRPESTLGRLVRGAAAMIAGFIFALDWQFAFSVVGLIFGAWLVYFGAGELLLLIGRGPVTAEQTTARRRTLGRTIAAGLTGIAGVVVAVLVFTSGPSQREHALASLSEGCNGEAALCSHRLNEVVFAGTHNSMSAADDEGWFIANQAHNIPQQLEDGIRLFLIDPHWGIEGSDGRVKTDFEAEGRDRNKVVKALPPETLEAAERLAGRIGIRTGGAGEKAVFLCHTVCELGATKMVDALNDIREFLDRNPGEIVIIFIEPYVSPADIETVFKEAGLEEMAAVLDRNAPLPTLGELVRSGKRVVVFTEHDADGTVPWYMDGFSFIQDTPLGVTKPEDLSCKRERGDADSPLLMLNQWADLFPPRRAANKAFQTRKELLTHAHECARKRGLPVNLIAVDHYDVGDLIPSVAELNRERIKAQNQVLGGAK